MVEIDSKRHAKPWAKFYKSSLWTKKRRLQLMAHPMCIRCEAEGVMRPATVANHIVPHRGDWDLFAHGDIESVCASHHNQDIQREETHGYSDRIGADGYPVDGKHPFNAPRATGKAIEPGDRALLSPPHASHDAPACASRRDDA